MSQLAPPPLHPNQRLPALPHLFRNPHLPPPPTMHLLLRPPRHSLRINLQLVRPLLPQSPR